MIPFLKKSYNDILFNIYNITNGNIIIGGSLSLRLQNIIDRDIDDVDLNILNSDWVKYESELNKNYRIYQQLVLNLEPHLKFRICTCLTKQGINEFHLFINYIESDLFNLVTYENHTFRVLKPELHLLDKMCMLEDSPTDEKTLYDIDCIKKFIDGK